jgi:hypothetical protein
VRSAAKARFLVIMSAIPINIQEENGMLISNLWLFPKTELPKGKRFVQDA